MQRSRDEGLTWEALPVVPGNTIAELATHPAMAGVVYARDGRAGRLWRSGDSGETWDPVSAKDGLTALAVTAGGAELLLGSAALGDAFVLKLSPAGELLYSSYAGGADEDRGDSIAVAPDGTVAILGVRRNSVSRPTRPHF